MDVRSLKVENKYNLPVAGCGIDQELSKLQIFYVILVLFSSVHGCTSFTSHLSTQHIVTH